SEYNMPVPDDMDVYVVENSDNCVHITIPMAPDGHHDLSDEELNTRRANWKAPKLKFARGILYKYAKTVSSASEGCVTDEF
ncbi:MAG: dihydroxy-acid dehydratase, partial [Rivularia sp. ALOHA_DT_140]|nr:dihydroxy-acid dehydratase [Rivularia sp. ALOHA_DT_140]